MKRSHAWGGSPTRYRLPVLLVVCAWAVLCFADKNKKCKPGSATHNGNQANSNGIQASRNRMLASPLQGGLSTKRIAESDGHDDGLRTGPSGIDNGSTRNSRVVPFDPSVRLAIDALAKELEKAGVSFAIHETPEKIVLEEHGFDVIERFVAATFRDEYGYSRNAMLQWNGSGAGILTVLDPPNGRTDQYTIDAGNEYSPFYLLRGRNGFRLASLDDISRVSREFEGLPFDMGDGWGLFDGIQSVIISKTGNPRDLIITGFGRPFEKGNDLIFRKAHRGVIVPRNNPVATLAKQEFHLVTSHGDPRYTQGDSNKRRLAKKDDLETNSREFIGEPIDYRESVLLDIGDDTYMLVSKTDFANTSDVLTEAPILEDNKPYVMVQEQKHKRIVLLANPRAWSAHFDDVVEKRDHLWVVSRQSSAGAYPIYHLLRPDSPSNPGDWCEVKPRPFGDHFLLQTNRDEAEMYIVRGDDPEARSSTFVKEPSDWGLAWLAEKGLGAYEIISKKYPERHSPVVRTKPTDYGNSALFEEPNASYLVSKEDPTKHSSKFARVLWPIGAARSMDLLGEGTKVPSSPPSKWILIEQPKGKTVWLSTDNFAERPAVKGEGPPQ